MPFPCSGWEQALVQSSQDNRHFKDKLWIYSAGEYLPNCSRIFGGQVKQCKFTYLDTNVMYLTSSSTISGTGTVVSLQSKTQYTALYSMYNILYKGLGKFIVHLYVYCMVQSKVNMCYAQHTVHLKQTYKPIALKQFTSGTA